MRHLFAIAALVWAAGSLERSASAQAIVKFEATQPNESRRILLRGELYRPDGPGPFPAVVLMHGCGGWQPAPHYALQQYGQELRKLGYVALNLDSFGPRYYSGEEMCGSNARLNDALYYRTADAFDALKFLAAQSFVDPEEVFLMGQSNGGSVAMRAAEASAVKTYNKSAAPGFRAVVAYYPWCGVYTGEVALAADLQIFSGGKDDWVSARECASVRTSGARFNVKVYPDAAHSFDLEVATQRYAGFLIGKDPGAAEDSKARMFGFFNSHLADDRNIARIPANHRP